MTTVRDALARATAKLPGEAARFDAEVLLCHALGCPRSVVYSHPEKELDAESRALFEALVTRRRDGWPVAYLLGTREFWSVPLGVTPDVLIPRHDTERLVEIALQRLAPERAATVVDLGTGSGAIALALARERPRAHITATDASDNALAVAASNAVALGLERVQFLPGSWYAPLGERRFDMIVSNPPYIASGDPHLGLGDLRYEPHDALVSGADGLDALRVIVAQAPLHLVPEGWLLVEHGHDQGERVRALFAVAGFGDVETFRDYGGNDRVTVGRLA
jgi:release factor glutamine methyltransferase